MRNSKKRELFIAVMLLVFSFAFAAVIIALEVGNLLIPLDVLFINTFWILVCEVAITALTVFLIIYVHWLQRHPSFGNLETSVNLFFQKMRQKLALKNAQYIAPPLQFFLWQTLNRNKSLLGIDPGPDMGSLSPNGWRTVYRNRTVYYVFELVTKNMPEQDEKILQQLINQFIVAELNNHGIVNLSATFNGYYSVYLDRLTYDDVRHVLVFDVLYVASDKAVAALAKAWERDRPKAAAPEMDVFDDEL